MERERVTELVNIEAQELWKSFENGVLQACDEVCRKSVEEKIEVTRGGGMRR